MTRAAFVLLVIAWPSVSLADSARCATREGAWVRVSVSSAQDEGFRARAIARLKSGMLARNLEVCTADEGRERSRETLAADVAIGPRSAGFIAITVDVRDASARRRWSREVDVSRLPTDGRPFAVAAAADELVRAGLAEVASSPVPSPPAPAPPSAPPLASPSATPPASPPAPPPASVSVLAFVETRDASPMPVAAPLAEPASVERDAVSDAPRASDARTPSRPIAGHVAAVAVAEYAAVGQTQLGADARASLDLTPRVAVNLRGGYRFGPAVASTHGESAMSALLAGGGVSVALTPRAHAVGLESLAHVDVLRVAFTARGNGAAKGSAGSGVAVTAAAGLGVWTDLGSAWQAVGEVSIGVPIRAVEVAEDGRSFTGVSGVMAGGALGVRKVLGP